MADKTSRRGGRPGRGSHSRTGAQESNSFYSGELGCGDVGWFFLAQWCAGCPRRWHRRRRSRLAGARWRGPDGGRLQSAGNLHDRADRPPPRQEAGKCVPIRGWGGHRRGLDLGGVTTSPLRGCDLTTLVGRTSDSFGGTPSVGHGPPDKFSSGILQRQTHPSFADLLTTYGVATTRGEMREL